MSLDEKSKLDASVLDESVIGRNRFWMKVYSTR